MFGKILTCFDFIVTQIKFENLLKTCFYFLGGNSLKCLCQLSLQK